MANVNEVILIGRLTRDVETKNTNGGMAIANIGFVVNNSKKNPSTGQYEDVPVFIDCTAFGKKAEVAAKYLSKGSQTYIRGHLTLDQWSDKTTGEKRSKLKVIIDEIQLLGSKQAEREQPAQYQPPNDLPPAGPGDENIPF